jgi:DNA-binding response OmpR family regulator
VLLIEGNEIGGPGLTLALSRAGHIVCRVQDSQASMLAAAGTLFDVGVIDMNASSEPDIDLPGLVRSLRGVQRGLPIILVGAELGGKDRHDMARAGGVSLLAKASAQENLVEAVSAAISDGSFHLLLSAVHNPHARARLVSREMTGPGPRPE